MTFNSKMLPLSAQKPFGMSKHCLLTTLTFLFLVIPFTVLSGQVPVEKSKEKTVISGKVYYLHTVKLGQTTYSISKAYSTTVETIIKENPSAADGIKEGEVLRIPVVSDAGKSKEQAAREDKPGNTAVADTGGQTWHVMTAGETVYSLSKRYNVTVDDIVKSNPGININDIRVGTRIAIPSAQHSAEKNNNPAAQPSAVADNDKQPVIQEQKSADGKYFYHKVVKGETLHSLSRQYNVSVKEIKRANKGFLFPKEGEYIQIPAGDVKEETNQNAVIPETVSSQPVVEEKKAESKVVPPAATDGRTELKSMRGTVRVALLLPFFLDENEKRGYTDSTQTDGEGAVIYKQMTEPGDWIFEPSVPFVEMYEGVLLAADSLRNLGLDVRLDVFDTDADTLSLDRLIASGKLKDENLILGPVFSSNLEKVARYARENNIPVVSPVPLKNSDILRGNTTLFRMSPSSEVEQEVISRKIASMDNANVVFVYSDSMMYDPRTVSFRDKLKNELQKNQGSDSAGMRELYFSGRMWKGSYVESRALESSLKPGKENVIVLSTIDSPKVSSIMSLLHNLLRRYDIRIVGPEALRDIETIDLKYFYDLSLMVPLDSYVDYSSDNVQGFLKNYYNRFRGEPNSENFAWRGFDMAFYFIGGVGMYGNNFLHHHSSYNPGLLSFNLHFRQADPSQGFENHSLFLMQYNKDMTITCSPAGE